LSKQTNNIVANKICVVSKIGLGTGIFGKMAVKGLKWYRDGVSNTIEENSSVFSLIRM